MERFGKRRCKYVRLTGCMCADCALGCAWLLCMCVCGRMGAAVVPKRKVVALVQREEAACVAEHGGAHTRAHTQRTYTP